MKPLDRRRLRIYGGAVVEKEVGGAVVEYADSRAWASVIFGEAEDALVLRATSLSSRLPRGPHYETAKPVELLMV